MSKARRIIKAAVVVGALAALLAPLAAHADVRLFHDARDDTASTADIRRVQVDNSSHDRSKVIVGVRQGNIRNGDLIRVYFDTRPRDPGPEFAVTGTYGSEYGMSRMETWTSRRQFIPWECGYRMRGDAAVGHTRIVVPRRCLDGPSRVRVAVLVQRGYPPTSTDWAKARRSWLDWVSR